MWADFFFSPHKRFYIEKCEECGEGEDEMCMRKSFADKKCPVADHGPDMETDNDIVLEIYNKTINSAENKQDERKYYSFIKPSEINACMDSLEVESDERKRVFKGVYILQHVYNKLSKSKPAKLKGRR